MRAAPPVLVMLLAACGGGAVTETDPCATAAGTCVGLQVRGAIAGIDVLLVHVSGAQDKLLGVALGPNAKFPVAVGVLLPDAGGVFAIGVGASSGGTILAVARSTISVGAKAHPAVSLDLMAFGGPRCDDGLRDGDETSIDCGGTNCPRCSAGKWCARDLDCDASLRCSGSPLSCQP